MERKETRKKHYGIGRRGTSRIFMERRALTCVSTPTPGFYLFCRFALSARPTWCVRFHGSCLRSLLLLQSVRVIYEPNFTCYSTARPLFKDTESVCAVSERFPPPLLLVCRMCNVRDVSSTRRPFTAGVSFRAARLTYDPLPLCTPSCFMCDRFECLMGNVPPFGAIRRSIQAPPLYFISSGARRLDNARKFSFGRRFFSQTAIWLIKIRSEMRLVLLKKKKRRL